MASVLNNIFGAKPSDGPDAAQAAGDADFADFSQAADPSPAPVTPGISSANPFGAAQTLQPYSKWYNVHERHSLSEFKTEGIILAVITAVLLLHLVGARLNRNKAKQWIRAHTATLTSEFASVGFSGIPQRASGKQGDELLQALADANAQEGDALLKEKSLFEFATYATGRANVAFLDVKLTLLKRFNPLTVLFETAFSFFVDSVGESHDVLEATLYPFDGKEAQLVPGLPGAAELRAKETGKSTYDGFVWALVHKERMKQLREDRYDVSLTVTKDHSSLPNWLTVMSENAEVTNTLLTPELIKAAEAAGDSFEYLIVSDQPIDKPKTLNEMTPRKRLFLKYRLPSSNDYTNLVPLFRQLVRLPDLLAQRAHFRPETLRKIKQTREGVAKQIQKADEESRAEERALERERAKKAKRDQELNALDPKGQKKYLEREREKELKKSMKRQTMRG
ncbi:hypothetical protein B0J18DRAFT_189817 [Chaetomium sp. MPI-SDFR-AT-0129]|nr:hypothetical protein B0J18DRAFT_189817 [Chaetomium sp. MPI-SDFR-AT-0129]